MYFIIYILNSIGISIGVGMCFLAETAAQNNHSGALDSKNFDEVIIEAHRISTVQIDTDQNLVSYWETISTGEYANAVLAQVAIVDRILLIRDMEQPSFEIPNDKLSAHKVWDTTLSLKLPADKTMRIQSDEANVLVQGAVQELQIKLGTGHCDLLDFKGDARIETLSGNIAVFSHQQRVKAKSHFGKVDVPSSTEGTHLIELYSIRGNITVTQHP